MASATPATSAASELTHGCVRCGAPVALDVAMCERCNPLGLKQPAATQAHGTVFLAIALSVAGLAILGRLALAGIGPFSAEVASVASSPPGLSVTLRVTNQGTKAGETTCRIYDPAVAGIGPESTYVDSPRIQPGGSATFSTLVTTLGYRVRSLAVECPGS